MHNLAYNEAILSLKEMTMTFTIYHSNHLDSLQYMASYIIQAEPLKNPLLPEYFIIHSSGMTNWLKSTLAENHNIFAHTRLEFPINQIVTIIEDLLTDEERQKTNLRISRLTLTWAVYDILIHSSLDDLDILEKYLSGVVSEHKDIRTMSLAEEIAGLFDKYLAYRPSWFSAWEKNQLLFNDSLDELWQQKIWQKIYQKVIPKYYLANIAELLKNIPNDRYDDPKIPTRLFVIGISTLPPLFIELLQILSQNIDIHLFFTNPSQYYWGDLTQYRNRKIPRIIFETSEKRHDLLSMEIPEDSFLTDADDQEQWLEFHGNPMLASFGKIGRDFIHLLSQYDNIKEIEAFSEPTTEGLLGYVQTEIFNLSAIDINEPKYSLFEDDNSISFHSHYSERREVEGLYDQLLHAFNDDPDLEPKDIIVMVSDIDRYRPMIEAVFGSPASKESQIPFSISDFTLGKNEPILDAFMLLLSIQESHFSVTDLLMLLEIPELAERFNITQDDRSLIKIWIENTNIKFGIDEAHLAELHVREDFTNTWLWGLKRLLLGYSFDEAIDVDNVIAFPYIQGGDAIILGHLADFVDALISLKTTLAQSYSLEEWRVILPEIWTSFYIDTPETQQRLQYLQSMWNTFLDEGNNIQFEDTISIHLVKRHLNESLSSFRPESRFLTGSVNFCTFVPMRSIPFKIVCMLGMNQDSFPHRKQYPEYDLMQAHPQRGDRSTVNDERYLFLEAILSAQQKLYISYIGKNIHNNSEMFPSLFVKELQHYLEEIAEGNEKSVTEQLTIHYPLSPFSTSLFEAGSKIQSFQKDWLPSIHLLKEDNYSPKYSEINQISIKSLIDAFKDPLKEYSIQNFGINYFQKNIQEIDDDELFSLATQDALERYKAQLELMEELFYNDISNDLLHDYAHHELFERYKAEGRLPKFAFAKLDWRKFIEPIFKIVLEAKFKGCEYGKEQPISIMIDDVKLEGTVMGVNSNQQFMVYVSKLNQKRQFNSYITHLINTVHLNRPITTTIYYYEDSKVFMSQIPEKTVEEATNHLRILIEGYKDNIKQPFISLEKTPLLVKAQKDLAEYSAFINHNYHRYDKNNVIEYLAQNVDFNEQYIVKVLDELKKKKTDIFERFVGEVTEKEAISYLYFFLNYVQTMTFLKRKELK